MALQTIRTPSELHTRHREAQLRSTIEADEYLRQIEHEDFDVEDYREIDQTAKNYLGYMVRNIGRCRWLQVRQAIQQYVAWKWMLAHADADTFPGAHNRPENHDPRKSYIYLRDQIQSGEWDRLTKLARQERKEAKEITEIEQTAGTDPNSAAIADAA
jgi:hypothetical protein